MSDYKVYKKYDDGLIVYEYPEPEQNEPAWLIVTGFIGSLLMLPALSIFFWVIS